jgi:hypothetical protein
MKAFIIFAVAVWLVCGLTGAWILDKLDGEHWQYIARGPLTLVQAINEKPVPYTGP